MQPEVPVKPRRKKLDVPVHRSEKQCDEAFRNTFSANYPSSRSTNEKVHARHGRKFIRENDGYSGENIELQEKLISMNNYLNKKLVKLKDKLNTLHKVNEEVVSENNIIKTQYQEISLQLNAIKKELALSQICQNCTKLNKSLDACKNEYIVLQKANLELLENENMLKNVIYRLNVQLECYQEKVHKHRTKSINYSQAIREPEITENVPTISAENRNTLPEDHWNHSHTPISWGNINAHTLGPLLDSYQETIAEKEQIIQNYETEFSKFTDHLKEIIKENENLHKKLTEDDDCTKNLVLDKEHLKLELKSIKEQNDLLIKKCALKQDKLEEILKCYEQKALSELSYKSNNLIVDEAKRDYKVVHEAYCQSRTEISALKEKNKSLVDVQDEFKNERQQYIPISVHTASVNECKKWYEELKHQYENEKIKLKDNIALLNNEVVGLSNKIAALDNEKTDLQNKIKSTEKQIKKTESKLSNLQETLGEVQLSRTALKNQLHKAMNFAKDLVKEQEALLRALNQRQQENKAVKKIGTDIANRMSTLRNELKTVQKEAFQELSEVEQKLQEKDSLISSLKKEHMQEIDRLRQIIKDKEERNVLFKENTSIPMPQYVLFRDKNLYP